jgi:hypothetical protein
LAVEREKGDLTEGNEGNEERKKWRRGQSGNGPPELSNRKDFCHLGGMKTVAVENTSLPDLLVELRTEDEILLTDHAEPIAKLVSVVPAPYVSSAANLRKRQEALDALKGMGGLGEVIADAGEWQRAIRKDRPLPLID